MSNDTRTSLGTKPETGPGRVSYVGEWMYLLEVKKKMSLYTRFRRWICRKHDLVDDENPNKRPAPAKTPITKKRKITDMFNHRTA